MNQDMLDKVIQAAKSNLKNSECLLPTFFVGNEREINIVGAVFDSQKAKDASAALVKGLVKKMKATFVVFIAESWTLGAGDADDFLKNKHKYSSVSDHPNAIEVVSFSVETKTGTKSGMAKILPNREMGEITWQDFKPGSMEGRFAQFLGPQVVRND